MRRTAANVGAGALLLALGAWTVAAEPPTPEPAGDILTAPPASPDPTRHHVFYLHGRIIEDEGRRPKHPAWGIYEYDQVLQALAAMDAVVISEARPSGTRASAYAKKIATQVQGLLDAGVPPTQVAVVGFSKGGWIAHLVSARLKAPIRYAMLAMCPGPKQPKRPLHGHLLALREKSDALSRSCDAAFAASPDALSKREIVVAIGGGHGAFYRPHDAWLRPLRAFLRP